MQSPFFNSNPGSINRQAFALLMKAAQAGFIVSIPILVRLIVKQAAAKGGQRTSERFTVSIPILVRLIVKLRTSDLPLSGELSFNSNPGSINRQACTSRWSRSSRRRWGFNSNPGSINRQAFTCDNAKLVAVRFNSNPGSINRQASGDDPDDSPV